MPKPIKATGIRWTAYCYGVHMTHLEELANNDTVQEKHAHIKGFLNKWEYPKYPMHLSIYPDVLDILV